MVPDQNGLSIALFEFRYTVEMLNWNDIETVFLDMDGTLLDLQFDNHFWLEFIPQAYADKHNITLEESLLQLTPRFQSAEGTLNWYCLDFWTEQLGLDIAALKRELSHRIQELPDTRDFLHAVRGIDKRCVLVTNAHAGSLNLKMEKTGLVEFFDAIVSSHSLALPKESPEFWQRLQQVEPFDPDSTLLVDDSLSVLQSARDYGLQYLVAITQPDTTKPEKIVDDFLAVPSLKAITPAVNEADG
jgi:putative hydrolase of the HAD superfamily